GSPPRREPKPPARRFSRIASSAFSSLGWTALKGGFTRSGKPFLTAGSSQPSARAGHGCRAPRAVVLPQPVSAAEAGAAESSLPVQSVPSAVLSGRAIRWRRSARAGAPLDPCGYMGDADESHLAGTGMIDKTVADVPAALADVADGATVLIGGFGESGSPIELIHGLIDQGARELTVVSNNTGNGLVGL